MLCVSQVSLDALKKRHAQGWLHEMESDLDQVILRIRVARKSKEVQRSQPARVRSCYTVCLRCTSGIITWQLIKLPSTVYKIWIM